MTEAQVTVDGKTLPLPQPFLVIATRNPVEHHGTYPLPESQLDRFLMRIRMGYPSHETERGIAHADAHQEAIELRFRERIGAVVLDGISRGDDEERLRQRERLAVHGDLRFGH